MRVVHTRGYNNSFVRCYRIGLVNQAKHLENKGRLDRLSDIAKTIDLHSGNRVNGIKAMMLVHTPDLPLHLQMILDEQTNFHNFCRAIAFTSPLYLLRESSNHLPASPVDHAKCSLTHTAGFPITKPTAKVELTKAESFSELELRGFLGDFQKLKGRMIVMEMLQDNGRIISQEQFIQTAIHLAGQLA